MRGMTCVGLNEGFDIHAAMASGERALHGAATGTPVVSVVVVPEVGSCGNGNVRALQGFFARQYLRSQFRSSRQVPVQLNRVVMTRRMHTTYSILIMSSRRGRKTWCGVSSPPTGRLFSSFDPETPFASRRCRKG